MRIQTPYSLSNFVYLGFNSKAAQDDEVFGLSIGKLYLGIYYTRYGFDLSCGILDQNGSL